MKLLSPIHGDAPTAHQITESNRAFLAAKSEYKLYLAVGQDLKKQLLAAVGDIYVNELAHPTLRYATVTVRNLLAHLFLTYGQITSDQLKANTNELERPWDPSEPIESLWKRVQDCRAFAELCNDPISLATTVRTVLLIIEKTAVFTLDLRFFRMQAAVAQTWPALKQHFTEVNTNRKRQLTSEGAGFHRANSAVNFPFAANTNPTMAEVIAAAQAATNSANAATATITECSTTNAGPSATADAAAYGYCWSHGLSKNRQHTSATCNHPADGHKREATLQKMMGGNNTILRPQHEPAVFVANPPR